MTERKSTTHSNTPVISLGDEFGEVVVKVNGATVYIRPDGTVETEPNDTLVSGKVLKVGDVADEDGWIYAGNSPDTHKPMYVAPADAGAMNWLDAQKAAMAIRQQGTTDTRLPSNRELKQLFNKKAAIGGFHEGDYDLKSWYWSAEAPTIGMEDEAEAWCFTGDGDHRFVNEKNKLSVRFVRS
jgi:hypothetical protein